MSTKIYDAYVVHEGTDVAAILEFFKGVRRAYFEDIADDVLARVGAGQDFPNFFELERELIDVSRKGLNHPLNFDASVVVYPYEGRLYVQVFGIGRDAKRARGLIQKADFLSDYSYWNNSEGPDDVSEQEWGQREAVWNAIFSEGLPSLDGLIIDLFTTTFFYRVRMLIQERRKGERE